MSNDWGDQSRLIHEGFERSQYGETAEPIYLTSGFVYDSPEAAEARFKGEEPGFVYSRFGNPTVETFERRLAALEGTEVCFATASGMAAVFAALICQVRAGDHLVASKVLFGSCLNILTEILPRFGVECTLVDGPDLDAWQRAIRPNTRVLFCESPANPTLELVDIVGVAALAQAAGACLVVDNAFASPMVQKAHQLGADVVVYSATKHIDGQGRCLGGAVCCTQEFFDEKLQPFVRHTGPAMSAFNAWVLAKALETLPMRVERMAASALAIAKFLEARAEVAKVCYPGLDSHPQRGVAAKQMGNGGTMLAFEMAGGKAAAFDLLRGLRLIKISNNLGDAKSLATHPETTTHKSLEPEQRAAAGITSGMVRLSIGLEDRADLIADLARALG